jgi:uncharacterized protein
VAAPLRLPVPGFLIGPPDVTGTVGSMRAVRMVYRKFDGSLHWHQWMEHLGEDRHGVWLGTRPNAYAQRASEPPVMFPYASVTLVPRDAWWTALFNDQPADDLKATAVYCDITAPAEFRDDLVTAVDLDLDVIRLVDGTVVIDDEDEFAEHRIKYGYPEDVVAEAEASCAWLAGNITTAEPFLSAYKPYLDQVR